MTPKWPELPTLLEHVRSWKHEAESKQHQLYVDAQRFNHFFVVAQFAGKKQHQQLGTTLPWYRRLVHCPTTLCILRFALLHHTILYYTDGVTLRFIPAPPVTAASASLAKLIVAMLGYSHGATQCHL